MADVLDIDNAEDFEVDDDGDRKYNDLSPRAPPEFEAEHINL